MSIVYARKKALKVISILFITLLLFGVLPPASSKNIHVEAGTAVASGEEFVKIAENYLGQGFSSVKSEMTKKGFDMSYPNYNYDWCAWFVSNVAREAGLPKTLVPNDNWAGFYGRQGYATGISYYMQPKVNLFKPSLAYEGTYKPRQGDLIFFDGDKNGIINHVGIVSNVTNTTIYTIEGNTGAYNYASSWVRELSYKFDDPKIFGYAALGLPTKNSGYTVTFDGNGGSGNMVSQKITYSNEKYLVPSSGFSKKNSIFVGWNVYTGNINKWLFTGTYNSYGWFEVGKQPSAYKLALWKPGVNVNLNDAGVHGKTIKLVANWGVDPNPTSSSSATTKNQKQTGLYKEKGVWHYYENGVPKSVTGMVQCKQVGDSGYGKWYYVVDGVMNKGTGLVKCVQPGISNGKRYYVKNGKLSKETGMIISIQPDETYGKWYYVQEGKFKAATGLVKNIYPYTENRGKWRYVNKGVFEGNTTGLVKKISDGKWYYVEYSKYVKKTGVVRSTVNNRLYYVYRGDHKKYTGWSVRLDNYQSVYVKKGEAY